MAKTSCETVGHNFSSETKPDVCPNCGSAEPRENFVERIAGDVLDIVEEVKSRPLRRLLLEELIESLTLRRDDFDGYYGKT